MYDRRVPIIENDSDTPLTRRTSLPSRTPHPNFPTSSSTRLNPYSSSSNSFRSMDSSSHNQNNSSLQMLFSRLLSRSRKNLVLLIFASLLGFAYFKLRADKSSETALANEYLNKFTGGWNSNANCEGVGSTVKEVLSPRTGREIGYGWGEKKEDYVDFTMDVPETEKIDGIAGYSRFTFPSH